MLGIGNSLMTSSTWNRELVYEYTSDFTSSVDGWEATNVEGTPTITYGENPPGVSGENDWLKFIFTEDQTGTGGIKSDAAGDGGMSGSNTKAGDLGVVSYKIYLSEDWDGSDDVATRTQFFALGNGTDVVQDSIVTINHERLSSVNWGANATTREFQILWPTFGDVPNNGATFLMKDFNIKVYR